MATTRARGLAGLTGACVIVASMMGLAYADTSQRLPELTTLQGTWTECAVTSGSESAVADSGDYCLDGIELDLGPGATQSSVRSDQDFDGDGSLETLAEEFAGLVGQVVIIEAERDDADADVFFINGLQYRDATTDRPPWIAAPPGAPPASPTVGGPPGGRPLAVVTTLTGIWESCGQDYCLDGQRVDPGPHWYLPSTEAPADYDGDGSVQSLAEELSGLVGRQVTLDVAVDGDSLRVVRINGEVYLDDAVGPPPWAGGPFRTSTGGPPQGVPAPADPDPTGPPATVSPGGPTDVPTGPPATVSPGGPTDVPTGPPATVSPGRPTDVPTGPPQGVPPGG